MNRPVYLGLSILDLDKTEMYEIWDNYLKPKYGENAKLCCVDTHSFNAHVESNDIYKILQKMLKLDQVLQVLKYTDHYLKEKIKVNLSFKILKTA